MRTNKELMNDAKNALQGQWLMVALCAFLFGVITSAGSSFIFGYFLLIGPLEYGFTSYIIKATNKANPQIEGLFCGFNKFLETFLAGLLMFIYTLLWSLLLIIPGIIASLRYSMTYFIMIDNPSLSASQAIDKSCEMMYGHKWDLFCLCCRFIGWSILCIFTFGIGYLFLLPYMQTSFTLFYRQIKGDNQPEIVTPPAMSAE
ncbi:MAG: DUF975 family protein [Muribaculaceae bacterium]